MGTVVITTQPVAHVKGWRGKELDVFKIADPTVKDVQGFEGIVTYKVYDKVSSECMAILEGYEPETP